MVDHTLHPLSNNFTTVLLCQLETFSGMLHEISDSDIMYAMITFIALHLATCQTSYLCLISGCVFLNQASICPCPSVTPVVLSFDYQRYLQ